MLIIFSASGFSSASTPPAPTDADTGRVENPDTGNNSSDTSSIFVSNPDVKLYFNAAISHRIDSLEWNIAGQLNGEYIDVLSDLTWEDIRICQVVLSNRTIFHDRLSFRGSLGIGNIYGGDNQDSDFAGSGRSNEFSRSNNNADDGKVVDLSLGLGYRFSPGSGRLKLAPMLGYSQHWQSLTMSDGYQTVSEAVPGIRPPDIGPFEDMLDSAYKAHWKGPWVGVDIFFDVPKPAFLFSDMEFMFTFEYHWADYNADADWNLREDFMHPKSFEHEANGAGMVFSLDANLRFNDFWGLNIGAGYQKWSTGSGTDRVFFSNGDIAETRLNEVKWSSTAVHIGVECRF
ncbi:MAG: hypothetical protein HKM93_00305 [Desulfobacteraceae bacterium]|nr:hypothetical protein [Desulfobacteraceae bacterium]